MARNLVWSTLGTANAMLVLDTVSLLQEHYYVWKQIWATQNMQQSRLYCPKIKNSETQKSEP